MESCAYHAHAVRTSSNTLIISCAIDATFPFLPHLILTVTEEKH